MVQLLVIRAREVSEVWKVFRYAKMENVQVGILMEPLLARTLCLPFPELSMAEYDRSSFPESQSVKSSDDDMWLMIEYEPSCIQYASRHLSALGLNSASGLMTIQDVRKKSEAIVTWWMLCLSDGFRSAFNRVQPALYVVSFRTLQVD
jgi:hypothetical protein